MAKMMLQSVKLKLDLEGQKSQSFDCIKKTATDQEIATAGYGFKSLCGLNLDDYIRVEEYDFNRYAE